jgi:hypothetical protein
MLFVVPTREGRLKESGTVMQRRIRPILFAMLLTLGALFLSCTTPFIPNVAHAANPPESTFFSTAKEEAYSTYQMTQLNNNLPPEGDLWPSCWSDDDNLYTANGDGRAFTANSNLYAYDLAVSRISGTPPT